MKRKEQRVKEAWEKMQYLGKGVKSAKEKPPIQGVCRKVKGGVGGWVVGKEPENPPKLPRRQLGGLTLGERPGSLWWNWGGGGKRGKERNACVADGGRPESKAYERRW